MKKIFTILFALVISTSAIYSQQGTWILGAGSNLANVSWQNYSLVPNIGYFITDNIVVGSGFTMGTSNQKNPISYPFLVDSLGFNMYLNEGGHVKERSFEISPYFRYYITESLYGQVDMAIGNTKLSEEGEYFDGFSDADASLTIKTSSFAMNFGVGYSLMWNDRIAIEPSLGLGFGSSTIKLNYDYDNGNDDSEELKGPATFGINAGLGINIRLGGE